MTRNEILRLISSKPVLAAKINQIEGTNFTRVKTYVLEKYISEEEKDSKITGDAQAAANDPTVFENAVTSLLVYLDQRGMLDGLLAKIK